MRLFGTITLLIFSFIYGVKQDCGRCHVNELQSLKSSKHWLSATVLSRYKDIGAKCLSCHAPLIRFSGDDLNLLLEKPEDYGINCSFCHFTRAVKKDKFLPVFLFEPGLFIFSTRSSSHALRDHGVIKWDESVPGDLCMACHSYRKGKLIILDGYAGGGKCSGCHGVHSLHTGRGLAFSLSCSIRGNAVKYTINLKNTTGHFIPSGFPGDWLEVILEDSRGHVIWRERFEKIMVNRDYKVLKDPGALFTDAFQVVKDNRLKPSETLTENGITISDEPPDFLQMKWIEVDIKGEARYKGDLTSPCKK